MATEFQSTPVPVTTRDMWDRIVRLWMSLFDAEPLVDVALVTGTNLVRHGKLATPRAAYAQTKGTAASAANVTVGLIDGNFVTVYASADCTVDLLVVL